MTRWNSDWKAAGVAEVLLATGSVDTESTNELGKTTLMGAFAGGKLDPRKVPTKNGADTPKTTHVSEHDEPACLISTGFPAQDVKMRDALLEFNYAMKRPV